MQTDYRTFLESKIVLSARSGFDVDPDSLHPGNFPHQNDAIIWALGLGKALIAMSFGLGKSRIQCEIARQVVAHTDKPFLVVCPLGVKHQFSEEDGPMLGMEWTYVRNDAEAQSAQSPYLITNYERVRDGGLTAAVIDNLGGVSLDEGSVLRSLGSKTQVLFNDLFADVLYRFVATATPSPNRYIELINYADFLSVMDRGQALTRWFKRDSTKAGNLTLHAQHEQAFWSWVSSWALFVQMPSDLGHSDRGYDLPELRTYWRKIGVDQTRAFDLTDNRGQRRLFLNPAGGAKDAAAEKRATMHDRIAAAMEIIEADLDGQWIVWCHQNAEQDEMRRRLEAAGLSVSDIYGALSVEQKEGRLYDWKERRTDVLLTKPDILGSGVNLQQCHKVVFVGIDYKFQDFIQAIKRTHRFQQAYPVDTHVIYAESEEDVRRVLLNKWQQHDALLEKMHGIVKKYGLTENAMRRDLTRQIGVERVEISGKLFKAVNNDCVAECRNMETDSVGLIHTSIPFGNHYEYSVQVEDFGHNPSDGQFWQQMDYLIPELLRVLMPGRIAAIHVKDRILYGHQTASGFMEVGPFSDECVTAFRKHGFLYEGRRTIVTDVVRENNSTYRLGWTEMSRDSSKMGSGLPEYLLLFRKPPTAPDTARADEPVTHSKEQYTRARWQVDAHSLWRSNGNGPLTPAELYDYQAHVARLQHMDDAGNLPASYFAEPPKSLTHWVWDDVVYMRTLNSTQALRKRENHICPLPFDIVERTIELYSNRGDVVFDPFGGLFTVPYTAVKLGRFGWGVELNPEYFRCGVGYCQDIEQEKLAPTLFDLLALEVK